MNTIIWARVSSREQKEGYSIDAQLRVTRNNAERMGWKVVKEFVVTESARRGVDRQTFNNMVSWVQKNAKKYHIQAILSHKLDRICRNMKDAVRMQELEDAHGVKLVFVDNEFGPGAAGILSFNVMAAVAQYYSDNLRAEVLKGMDERIKQGWPIGLAPYGYLNVKDKNEPVIPDPEKSITVIRIFELYATGKYTLKSLTDRLYKDGHIYRKSQPKFNQTALSYILNNRFYIGELKRGEIIYQGQYRLLVDPVLFEKCQVILKGKYRQLGNPEILFSGGILRCAYCGRTMVGEHIRRKLKGGGYNVHVYYRCSNNNPSPDHPRVRWKEADIESAIMNELDGMKLPSDEAKRWFLDAIEAFTADVKGYNDNHCKTLRKRKAELENMQDKLLNIFLTELVNEDIFNTKTEELKAEAKSIGKRLDDIESGHDIVRLKSQKIVAFSQNVQKILRGSNFTNKRTLLQLVSSNRRLSDVSLCIERVKPFDILAKHVPNSTM